MEVCFYLFIFVLNPPPPGGTAILPIKLALHQGNNWQHVACNIF
jgi:hypothetical protein